MRRRRWRDRLRVIVAVLGGGLAVAGCGQAPTVAARNGVEASRIISETLQEAVAAGVAIRCRAAVREVPPGPGWETAWNRCVEVQHGDLIRGAHRAVDVLRSAQQIAMLAIELWEAGQQHRLTPGEIVATFLRVTAEVGRAVAAVAAGDISGAGRALADLSTAIDAFVARFSAPTVPAPAPPASQPASRPRLRLDVDRVAGGQSAARSAP